MLLFAALIYALAGMAGAGSRRLTAPPLVYLGEVSFAVYMACVPWQFAFSKAASMAFGVGDVLPPWLWWVQLLGVVVAAMALHHLVERPARVFMRLHDPFRPRAQPAALPTTMAATL